MDSFRLPPPLTVRQKEFVAISQDQAQLDYDMAMTAFLTTQDPRNIVISMPIVTTLNPRTRLSLLLADQG